MRGGGVGLRRRGGHVDAARKHARWPPPSASTARCLADLLNFSQYKSIGDVNVSVSLPYRMAGARVRTPGWDSICLARSPSAPADCQGDACIATIDV